MNRDRKWSGLSDPQPFLPFLPFEKRNDSSQLVDASYVNNAVVAVLFLFLPLLFDFKLEDRKERACFKQVSTTERSKEEDFSGEISRQGASLPLLLGPICQQLVDMQKGGPSSRRGEGSKQQRGCLKARGRGTFQNRGERKKPVQEADVGQ